MSEDTQVTQDGDEVTVTIYTDGFAGGTPVSLFMTVERMRELRAALEEAGA